MVLVTQAVSNRPIVVFTDYLVRSRAQGLTAEIRRVHRFDSVFQQ